MLAVRDYYLSIPSAFGTILYSLCSGQGPGGATEASAQRQLPELCS